MNLDKIASALIGYIEYFDSNRTPVKPYLIASLSITGLRKKFYLKEYDSEFYEKIRKENSWYLRELQRMPKGRAIIFVISLFIEVFIAVVLLTILNVQSRVFAALLIFFLLSPSFYYFYKTYTMVREEVGKECDERLKKTVQEIIDYAKDFFKNNQIDATKFPIELRHDDYKGLIYKDKKGINGKFIYTAYIGEIKNEKETQKIL